MRYRWTTKVVAGLALLSTGCSLDESAEPSGPGIQARIDPRSRHVDPPGAIPTFPELVDFVSSVVATEGLPPALTDQELVSAVAAANGSVFIALKSPGAQRTRETGRTPGISKAAYLEGQSELERLGVQVVRTYRSLAFFEARIDPETAPALRRLDFVDDVGAAGHDVIASAGGSSAGTLMFSETQDWGLQKVRADLVWAAEGNYGDSARVTVIDTGIDSTHYHVWANDGPGHGSSECTYIYLATLVEDCYQPTNALHGSHVSGILAARKNSTGYVGISPQPKHFRSIRVCYYDTGYSQVVCPIGSQIAALNWLENNGGPREIINMSYGGAVNAWWRRSSAGLPSAERIPLAGASWSSYLAHTPVTLGILR